MADIRAALQNRNVQAFLRVIRQGETNQSDVAYRMMFGGQVFDDFGHHPNLVHVVGQLKSTAAGAYQFLGSTWGACQRALNLPDFSPASQDLAAVWLIANRGALDDVIAGRVEVAIGKCAREWASLPGSPYGQPTRTLIQALATYSQWGGSLQPQLDAPDQPTLADRQPAGPTPSPAPIEAPEAAIAVDSPKGSFMAPIIAALLPSLISAIPKLGALFGSGSEVATRNVKAAEIAFSVAKDALGASNEQEVVTKLQADPAAVVAVAKAIEDNWFALTESGGGGIDGARKADAAVAASGDMLHSPSFWIAVLLLPLVYMIVANLIGVLGASTWSDDARAGLTGSIVGSIIGGVVGYYFGQTTSRNRTPQQ